MIKNKRHQLIIAIVAILLLIPFIAMQFTDEVAWTIFDFALMGGLLLGTGFLFEFAMRKVIHTKHRIFIGIAILAAFQIIWTDLAVGVFGTPFSGH
jgi:hypothetical protein